MTKIILGMVMLTTLSWSATEYTLYDDQDSVNFAELVANVVAPQQNYQSKLQEMHITIKNNSYKLKSSVELKELYDEFSCDKEFELTFESKYNLFEYYDSISSRHVLIVSDLYNIRPSRAFADDKAILHIVLNETDIKKLYRRKKAKILLSTDIFSDKVLSKELAKLRKQNKFNRKLEPTIRVSLNPMDLQNTLKESEQQHSVCMKQKEEKETPVNKLKNYFGFN